MAEKATTQIYCWYGDNDFAIFEQVKKWREMFAQKYSALNVVSFDREEANVTDLVQALKNAMRVDSLFGSEKLIILRNFLQPEKKEKKTDEESKTKDKKEKAEPRDEAADALVELLDKFSGDFFIVFIQIGQPDGRRALFLKLKKLAATGRAEIKEFKSPRGFEFKQLIRQIIEKKKARFDDSAIELLMATVGNGLWQINQEIEKLIHYRQGEIVRREDVDFLVKGKFNDNIFALMDEIGAGQKSRALELLHDQLDNGVNEIYLLAMLTRQIRLLIIAHDLVTTYGIKDKNELARRMKVHPFVAQKVLVQTKQFSREQLESLYRSLLVIDTSLKSDNVDARLLFDRFIAGL